MSNRTKILAKKLLRLFFYSQFIEPQDRDPNITFRKYTYYIGERLEANCTTSPSKPPAHITWFLNDDKVIFNFFDQFESNSIIQNRLCLIENPLKSH